VDVAEWLRGLGLGQYAPALRDNDIDGEVLRRLTGDDLRELGVKSIGHRRRLLDAIAVLTAGSKGPDIWTAPAPGPEPQAERRRLTVMLCDLVGSTALSARLDPEDLREVIRGYHHAVADTVARFAGFVAKYMGDGVLAYFGYPQAHEDDAERAVRAGLWRDRSRRSTRCRSRRAPRAGRDRHRAGRRRRLDRRRLGTGAVGRR
jgi:class 3 adenylate cyclase